jgi:hypothetical protein
VLDDRDHIPLQLPISRVKRFHRQRHTACVPPGAQFASTGLRLLFSKQAGSYEQGINFLLHTRDL